MEIQYLIPLLGLVGLVVMIFKAIWVGKQDSGDANMVELAGYIARIAGLPSCRVACTGRVCGHRCRTSRVVC